MRRLELLINQTRRATENLGSDITDAEFIQYFNDAQERMQTLIFNEHPESGFFTKQGFLDLQSNVEEYSLDSMVDENGTAFKTHIYAKNSIALVERTDGGNAYYPMKLIGNKERRYGWGYILRDNKILFAPFPVTGQPFGMRAWYVERLPKLDIRRAQVNGAPVGNVIAFDNAISGLDFNDNDGYISVVDKFGNIKASDLEIVSFTASDVTVNPFEATAVASVSNDDYIVFGEWASTHSQLPETCERYLLSSVERKIFMRDSSTDTAPQDALLRDMEKELVELFADNIDDANHVPISSTDYMIW